MNITVHTHIAGSVCVVQIGSSWENYIDARRDVRAPNKVHLEHVRAGRVQARLYRVDESCAPGITVDWLRNIHTTGSAT